MKFAVHTFSLSMSTMHIHQRISGQHMLYAFFGHLVTDLHCIVEEREEGKRKGKEKQGTLTLKPQYQHAYSPHCCPYISYGTSWENLHKRQDIPCLVIIFFILMTCMFDQIQIL